jgi:hypothetical protein
MSHTPTRDTIPLVKTPVRSALPSGAGSRASFRNAHAGIVVMRQFALRSLPDQLFECRPEQLGFLLDHFPLRGRWQRNPEIGFQPL